jgi:hypothetical protein
MQPTVSPESHIIREAGTNSTGVTMHPMPTMTEAPFDRFRAIYLALDGDTCWWSDGAWLRFAAQAAILSQATPKEIARAIRHMADQLQQHVQWYDALSSPLNLIVAATLVQRNDTVKSFNAEMTSVSQLLSEAGVRLGGAALIRTVLAMHYLGDGAAASEPSVQRIIQLYAIMKEKHWWLTGRGDIFACALLASSDGPVTVIEGKVEAIYSLLLDHGFNRGHHVLIAANILTLAKSTATAAADRFLALIECVHSRSLALWTENYDALALMSLLDHDPERIAVRLDWMTTALQTFKPLPNATINFSIAADLVFLELVRLDDNLCAISDPAALERVEQLIRYQSAVSLMMVDVPKVQLRMVPGM